MADSIILGPDGRPARLSESDRFEALMGSYDSYLATSIALAPFNPDTFIASKGYRVLDDMMAMSAVSGSLNIIRDAVLYKGWSSQSVINDQAKTEYSMASELADGFEYCLNNIEDEAGNAYDFRQDIQEMLYGIHTGFHVAEINWRVIDEGDYAGKDGFKMFAHKPCQQIGFQVDPRTLAVQAINSYTPQDGYAFNIPVEKCLRYTFRQRNSLPHGNGVGRIAYKHSWTIDFLYRFWNIAMEIFGSPFILAKAGPTQMKLAGEVIKRIRQGAAPVLPAGVEAQLMEIAGGGLAAFKASVEHHSQEIKFAYLHNTLTSGEGQRVGSMALGKVHQDTQEFSLAGRRRDIENVITQQLARRWVRANYGPKLLHLTPQFSLGNWDQTDSLAMAQAFDYLIKDKVMHPGEDQIRQKMGLAPADPEIKEKLEKMWDAPTGPITINTTPPKSDPPAADDPPADDTE